MISAIAPAQADRAGALAAWLEARTQALFLSAVTVAEIESGIRQLDRKGVARRAAALRAWLDALLHLYGDRVLAFDLAAARVAGMLSDRARAEGASPGFADLAIGATARAHGLELLTRNTRHFAPMGLQPLDPFATLPA